MNDIIVGLGEALWDVLPNGKKLGGAPANFAFHVSQFGFTSKVISAVGNDDLGDELVASLSDKKLVDLIERVPYPTGTVQVTLNEAGIPCYEIKENVAWDNIPMNEPLKALALQTRVVCFGSLAQRNAVSRTTIHQFLDLVPDKEGTLKIFDINLRQHFYTQSILDASLKKSNVLKINDEELEEIQRIYNYQGLDVKASCQQLLEDFGLSIVILTCGERGSYVFTPQTSSFLETPKVHVVDTVGAGDSFTAAFVAGLLKGKSIAMSHQFAVDVSAYVCTQKGAMPALPPYLLDQLR